MKALLVQLRFGLSLAIGGVTMNKLRSALTLLGVMIGVASVVSLVAIGEGARMAITEQFESLGTNIIRVQSHRWDARLTITEAEELAERVPSLLAAMPVVQADAQVKWRRTSTELPLLGVTEDFPVIRDHQVLAGRFISHLDVQERLRVAVVGYGLVDQLFGGRDPLGEAVYLGGQRFTVVGVMAPKGAGMAGGIDGQIIVPVTAAQRLTKSTRVSEIWAKARDKSTTHLAMVQVSRYFRHKFNIQDPEEGASEDPYGYYYYPRYYGSSGVELQLGQGGAGVPAITVTSVNELVQEANAAQRVMTLMLGGIAGVSLLVSGLGIMNIMLISVAERSREIGLRKAVGAHTWHLVYQFLLEALICAWRAGYWGWGWAGWAGLFAR